MIATRLLLASALLAGSLGAQRKDTLVVTARTTARAAAVWDYGFAAYPVTVLAPLGAVIMPNADRIEVKVFGTTLWFRPGHGTFADNGLLVAMQQVAFLRNGVLYLPDYFYSRWLPTRHARMLRYDGETGTLTRSDNVVVVLRPTTPARAVGRESPRSLSADSKATDSVHRPPAVGEGAAATRSVFVEDDARQENVPAQAVGQVSPASASATTEMHLRISGLLADNFFQAPRNAPAIQLRATSAEMRFLLRVPAPRVNVHARASQTFFDGFAPSVAAVGGFDFSGKVHVLEGTAGYQRRSPRLGAGDQAGFASSIYGTGSYGVKLPGELQLSVLGHYYDIYLHALATDSRYYGGGGALRYRGFGYQFSPEVAEVRSSWQSSLPNENYSERTRWAAVRAVPWSPVWLFARYRRDMRDYTTSIATGSNFGRRDTRDHWTVAADVRLRRLTWSMYYTHEDAVSTRADRSFTSQLITSGLSYRIR